MYYNGSDIMMNTAVTQPTAEPFIDKWILFYMLLSLGYVILAFYGKFKQVAGEEKENTLNRAVKELNTFIPFVVWTYSTIAFFLIYGAYYIWA